MSRKQRGLAMGLVGVLALLPRAWGGILQDKAFSKPELYISTSNVDARPLVKDRSNAAEWNRFFAAYGADTPVFMDPRSGTLTNMIVSVPLIPGTGVGNHLGLTAVDSTLVGAVVRDFIVKHREVIGVDVAQLGTPIAAQVTDDLWQVSIPQLVDGIPVRDGRALATLSHGNLVLAGTEKWANATLDTKPTLTAERALDSGFEAVGGKGCKDRLWKEPMLEIVPFSSGEGYGHRLVWVFGFQRADEIERWETLVDAKDGQLVAFRDTNEYDTRRITGGVYPLANTGICPSREHCGILQSDWPMPYADTGLAAPNDYTNDAGLYENSAGDIVTTTLNGRYVKIENGCGPLLESSESGNLNLGGAAGQHDCATPGSAGNTAAARSAFYHLNKMHELARGWLPTSPWLSTQLVAQVSPAAGGTGTCGAFYVDSESGTVQFLSGEPGQCTHAGESSGIVKHEWGHGLDFHDAIGSPSNSTEAYADIAAKLGDQASCHGYGYWTGDQGCGFTSDGTGANGDLALPTQFTHCLLDCSGKRDADWDRHADHTPDTPQNLSCPLCGSGTGPCGRETHCDGQTSVQAAWDLAARDLQAPPFNLSRTDAFIVTTKLFMQGSGNIGNWHACNCAAGTADGCGASNAYMQWLAADDDNGNLSNGTPHMTALYAAFARHGIACAAVEPHDGGCSAGPSAAPTVVATAGSNLVSLSWSAVSGATRYRVLRTEGEAGCDRGMAVIAETTGLSYTDTDLMNGRAYSYVVHAVGSSAACFGRSSACQLATPIQCAGALSLSRTQVDCNDAVLDITLEDSDLRGAGSQAVQVTSTSEATPETVALLESPAGSGRLTGTIALTIAPPSSGDGSISIAHGDTIHVGYVDASRCGTPNVAVAKIAQVDCQGPVITNVHVAAAGGTAQIRWDTDEPAQSRVVYGSGVPPDQVAGPYAALVTSHEVPLAGLQDCTEYFFSVSSTDRLGHASVADNGGSYFTFETAAEPRPIFSSPDVPLLVPDDPFPGALATIEVTDVEVILDLDVQVKASFPETTDIRLSLIGPDTTEIILADRPGITFFGAGDYADTVFDDAAATGIRDGEAPYAGSFRPEQPLSIFTGTIATGLWKLRAADLHYNPSPLEDYTLTKFEMHLVYPPRICGPSLELTSHTSSDACSGSGAGDGNSILEPGETIQVSIQVTNEDADPATGVSGRLTSFTPGVFVTRAISSYPDLAPGASAPNLVPYELYVDPSVPCGSTIVLRVDGTTNAGGWRAVFPLRVGDQVNVTTPYANNTPKAIPDLATARSFINVAEPWILTDVDVSVSISHGAPVDLDVFLVAPDGTRIELTTDNGGGFGTGYADTVFDDEAATPITAGSNPFTGHFRPETPLAVLDGMSAAGAWTLEVTDDHQSVAGTLLRWSLAFEHVVAPPCATCPVTESPTEVLTLAWSGAGKDTLAWGATPRATTYKLYRGLPSQLTALLDANVDSCERAAGSQLTSGPILTESPSSGSFFWFLARAENSIGGGPIGSATAGERVLNASGACP